MRNYSAFDILGPVMVGPSSSHTAGAARIGKIAMQIGGKDFTKVKFLLHGSFARTYRGHGTDRALVAGVLGMDPDDARLKDSLEIAKQMGIDVSFDEIELDDAHPNTVKIVLTKEDGSSSSIVGSSIGGGNVIITEIDGDAVEFTSKYPTIMVKHYDRRGMINKITAVLVLGNINIATMRVSRKSKGNEASMIIETDNRISDEICSKLSDINGVISARVIQPA